MADSTGSTESREKLWSMIKDIQFCMMVTEDGSVLRARPMAAAQTEFDGTLYFYSRAGSHKVEEVQHDQKVCLTYAEPKDQNYVSLSGTARLVFDRDQIKQHWTESLRTWFPKGSDDPDIAILKVDVTQGEYWDAPNSTMVHAYGYVKAALTGTPPSSGDNEKVKIA